MVLRNRHPFIIAAPSCPGIPSGGVERPPEEPPRLGVEAEPAQGVLALPPPTGHGSSARAHYADRLDPARGSGGDQGPYTVVGWR